jgi:outer membrane lipoprotein-sorting protein
MQRNNLPQYLDRRFATTVMLVVCALLGCSIDTFAQYQGYTVVKDVSSFKSNFKKQSADIKSISSKFTQEKVLTALTEKITSNGTFQFKRENKVKLEYLKPFSYTMVMSGDKMLVRDDQKENRMNLKSNKLFQQINKIMIDCIQGSILESKDFTTRVFENDKMFLLEMTPVSKSLKNFFETIVLKVEKSDYSLSSMQMNEQGGDLTLLTFTDKKINVPVPDEAFAF